MVAWEKPWVTFLQADEFPKEDKRYVSYTAYKGDVEHMWLSRVKCGVLVALVCFELEVRLCSMGDEVLAMRSPEL